MAEQKKTILIVDDEPDVLTYLSTLLEDNGYETITAEDGEVALAKLKERVPDLITLDITMPERSGVRLYRDIKESEAWKHVPVVIVTGVTKDFERFIKTRRQVPPPEGYLSKPIDQTELLAKVAELI